MTSDPGAAPTARDLADTRLEGADVQHIRCEQCGDETPFYPNKRFCSKACKDRWRNRRRVKQKTRLVECGFCGRRFYAENRGKATQRHCSYACAQAGRSKPVDLPPVASCVLCRQAFRCRNGRIACPDCDSRRTSPRWFDCAECGLQHFAAYPSQRTKFCSDRCQRRWNHREVSKRMQREGRSYSQRKRQRIYDRDGWVCQLCGGVVPRDLEYDRRNPDPLYPTLDHIVPRADGGTNDDWNLQLAHWKCNSEKADGLCGSQLLLPVGG